MSLFTVVYEKESVKIREVVDVSTPRFQELVKLGIEEIKEAPKNTQIGLLGNVKELVFKEGQKQVTADIFYSTDENKIVITHVPDIKIRGYEVTKGNSKYGNILSVNLAKQHFALIDGAELNNIIYALRTIQRFNSDLLSELNDDETEERSKHDKK